MIKQLLVLTVFSITWVLGYPPILNKSHKIVGGQTVDIEDYPYNVQLLFFNYYFCGGSIISEDWVISAAHCTKFIPKFGISVRAGTSNLEEGGVVSNVDSIINHPKFSFFKLDYDFSLIKLCETLTFTPSIQKISLPSPDAEVPEGTLAEVSGWGALAHNGRPAKKLQAVKVPTISKEQCQKGFILIRITDNMLCAAYDEGGKDACQGDSGGPLVVDNVLVGVVSFGKKCGKPGNPGVYAKVSRVRDFITEVTGI